MAKQISVMVPMTRRQTTAVIQALGFIRSFTGLPDEIYGQLSAVQSEIMRQRIMARWGSAPSARWTSDLELE